MFTSGSGGKAYCAGGDVVTLYKAGLGQIANSSVLANFPAYEYLLDLALTTMKPIHIAFWNGVVMGGGVGLSCFAPIRIATDNTVFAMPETGIGFFTDVAASFFLPRLVGYPHEVNQFNPCLGMYLGLTGSRLKGKDLVHWGVATHYVP